MVGLQLFWTEAACFLEVVLPVLVEMVADSEQTFERVFVFLLSEQDWLRVVIASLNLYTIKHNILSKFPKSIGFVLIALSVRSISRDNRFHSFQCLC